MAPHAQFPGLAAACFLIAIDNGGINRARSEARWQTDFATWVGRQPRIDDVAEFDAWLSSQPSDRLMQICTGGQDDAETIAAKAGAPAGLDALLDNYFEEVC